MSTEDMFAQLLGCLRTEYAPDGDVTITGQVGQSRTEDWCEQGCGMAYVRLDTSNPSIKFPLPDQDPGSGAPSPLAVRWHVGIIRCVSKPNHDGSPPSAEDQTADTAMIIADHDRLLRVVRCCTSTLRDRTYLLGAWQPTGDSGGCAGGYWTLTTRLVV